MTEFSITDLKKRMNGAVEVLRKEFGGLRTGRASASLLEPITVAAYGSEMPLNQVSTVSVPEARMLAVQVWDKGLVKAVEKAIRTSDLGLNPAVEGNLIRVPIPELSEERREELVKVAARYAEAARVVSKKSAPANSTVAPSRCIDATLTSFAPIGTKMVAVTPAA